ncbi:sensor histidine kinase [Marinibacterium sp. SX1]|uniref:sensor histidine kinase n=1 Tax=Marinibacterium sp. SX1 TaxID=3388424 RepID=UPI003D16476C
MAPLPQLLTGTLLPPPGTPGAAAEAHHRIANNLQLVSALITGELRGLEDAGARDALYRTQARISAIAGVHRMLQGVDDEAELDLGAFLATLCHRFGQTLPDHRRLHVSADPVQIAGQSVSLISVVTIELIMNAAKHAYGAVEPGDIHVTLRKTGPSGLRLAVEDHGTGPRQMDGSGLGSILIEATLRQLGGQARWENARPGLRVVLQMSPGRR